MRRLQNRQNVYPLVNGLGNSPAQNGFICCDDQDRRGIDLFTRFVMASISWYNQPVTLET